MTKSQQEIKGDGVSQQLFEDMANGFNFLKDIMTDDVAENLASSISGILTIGKEISDEKINSYVINVLRRADVLSDVIDEYEELKEDGTLETLKGILYGMKSLKDMVNDEAIQKLGNYIGTALDSLPKIDQFLSISFDEIPMALMKGITSEELKEEVKKKEKVTNKDLISLFNDPATKKGLWVFLLAMREMGKRI
ncbi:hypothetical protein [Sulfuracidifex tepidarius]|uniref:DUF1641 domain-containing protein n=1 Tax=Sulfuracidifex tepidarius TaxID=1294262 RepID=A0A510DYW8_9CREN|nr:hypothetical protein [Sulfuracidifex tepidarius]BBG25443.1 hypothetical protein IC006_2779 [Sulfuracidifex tepidarius]BBG28237.1 hypothetical protein IC007_2793 [Sulfuracidifex tepidarius]